MLCCPNKFRNAMRARQTLRAEFASFWSGRGVGSGGHPQNAPKLQTHTVYKRRVHPCRSVRYGPNGSARLARTLAFAYAWAAVATMPRTPTHRSPYCCAQQGPQPARVKRATARLRMRDSRCLAITQDHHPLFGAQSMRTPGVEPGSQAWGACMMPLHYARRCKQPCQEAGGMC